MNNRLEEIKDYRKSVSQANKESIKKEHFKNLLVRLFDHHEETKRIVELITSGAEKPILNIPRKDKIHRGSADTLYNKVIIEFENDLKKSLKHAKEQLAGYLLGEYRSGNGNDYVLIASDMIDWRVYAIAQESLDNLDTLQEDEVVLTEIENSSFKLKEGNEENFYFWIDRILFKEGKQPAKLRNIEAAFGHQSIVFRQAYLEMQKYYDEVKDAGEIQVSYEQWKKSLSIAYDNFNDTTNNFIIHTYLSLFSKMLAYQVLSNDDYIDDAEMQSIIDGSVFYKFNINNFVENDFFAWIRTDEAGRAMKETFRRISQELSTFDFSNVDEDVLKGVYQELVDLDTRHKLGEYYTPDWLCERVVAEYAFKPSDKILDPSCGSGSFLRAVIDKLKRDLPDANIEDINAQVYGIDIHPLSVQIAKTTVLLALGAKVRDAKTPIHLNVILANTLLTPKGVETLFMNQFNMEIDKQTLFLDTAIFEDANLFDKALDVSEELAEQTANGKDIKLEGFTNNLKQRYKDGEIKPEVAGDFYQIYQGLKKVKETGRDSIWKFIVQNLYKPYFLKDSFDYIIGNPPWFVYKDIKNESYQETLLALAKEYDVATKKEGTFAHLEIAAIFLAYCSKYFLKNHGRIAFVLPRSFFVAKQHDNIRNGKADGFILEQVWDLKKVSPLFRIPSCVLFGKKSPQYETTIERETYKAKILDRLKSVGIAGKVLSGLLSNHNCNWNVAEELLTVNNLTHYYSQQGNASAFSTQKGTATVQNPYKKLFKQGAIIVPRTFYFVELAQDAPIDYTNRIISIKTSESVIPDAKMPWKSFTFKDRIESNFLFFTAISKSILPFTLFNPNMIVLPATISEDNFKRRKIEFHSIENLRETGFLHAARWFDKLETVWQKHRTEINNKYSSIQYINYQNKITEQDINIPYIVLYNSSAKDANATIVKRKDYDFEFVVDHKTYMFFTSNLNEALYLTAIFNSTAPNKLMKDFQTIGNFGARDVHKKILDIYYPRYDATDATHIELAKLSEKAHAKAKEYLTINPPQEDLSPMRLGKLRLDIKRYLSDEMQAIDNLVERIIK